LSGDAASGDPRSAGSLGFSRARRRTALLSLGEPRKAASNSSTAIVATTVGRGARGAEPAVCASPPGSGTVVGGGVTAVPGTSFSSALVLRLPGTEDSVAYSGTTPRDGVGSKGTHPSPSK